VQVVVFEGESEARIKNCSCAVYENLRKNWAVSVEEEKFTTITSHDSFDDSSTASIGSFLRELFRGREMKTRGSALAFYWKGERRCNDDGNEAILWNEKVPSSPT
jgi:hypothetical protein